MPLNKKAIKSILASFKFPITEYSLLMGSALVFLGVKEYTNDVDLGCSANLFESIITKGYRTSISRSGYTKIIINENVSIYKEWLPFKTVLIDGIPVSDLESVISDKKRFGRPKDIADIALIDEFVRQRKDRLTTYFPVLNQGRTLRGTLHTGKNEIPALLVHGYFSSNKIGVHRLYVQIANTLAQIGFNVLRIDLSGMGESDGDIADFDFADHISDVNAAATQLMHYTGSSKIHYIGHCIGTCTAFQSVMQNQNFVESLTLLSPFMPSESNYRKLLINDASYDELQTSGSTFRNGLACRKSFIHAGYAILKYPEFCKSSGIDSLIYVAENDEMVCVEELTHWAIVNNLRFIAISGADHNYKDPMARIELLSKLEERFHLLNEKEYKTEAVPV